MPYKNTTTVYMWLSLTILHAIIQVDEVHLWKLYLQNESMFVYFLLPTADPLYGLNYAEFKAWNIFHVGSAQVFL